MSREGVFRFGEHLVTAVITLVVAYIGFQGTKQSTNADLVNTLYLQVRSLEKKVFEQNTQITQLRIELEKKYETSSVLKSFIDNMPYPAWVKLAEVDDEGNTSFVMWHVNNKYAERYGVSQARYIGNTDFRIWPRETADQFYLNDLAVLKKLDYRCVEERWPQQAMKPHSMRNPYVTGFVCKWATKINGRTAIAGQIFERDKDLQVKQ